MLFTNVLLKNINKLTLLKILLNERGNKNEYKR